MIIGIVVGVLALIIIIAVIVYFCYCRKKRGKVNASEQDSNSSFLIKEKEKSMLNSDLSKKNLKADNKRIVLIPKDKGNTDIDSDKSS